MKANVKNSIFIAVSAALILLIALSVYFIAEKTLIYPRKYSEIVKNCSNRYGVEENLIYAVMKAESKFDSSAVSKKGAKGLMQITDGTGAYIAGKLGRDFSEEDLFSPEINIEYGAFYLNYLLGKFENPKTALAAYNAGEGKVKGWLKDENCSDDGKILKFIPYKETEDYVVKVLKFKAKYEKIYG